ncbi:hypothetical protein BH09VER1_BH09VER1_37490 [soil metagenome]
MTKTIKFFLAPTLMFGVVSTLNAADFTWNPPTAGSGGTISWNDAPNWGGSVPANDLTSDIAVFNSTTAYNFQPNLDAFTVQSINGLQMGGASTVAVTLSAGSGTQTTSGATLVGSTTITLADVTGLVVGQNVAGTRIPVGTFVTGIDAGTNTITISQATSGGTLNSATALTFNSSLAIGSSGITLAAGTPNVADIITAPIVLGANQQWSNLSSRSLAIQGAIYLDTFTLTLTGSAGSTISFNGPTGSQSIGGTGDIVVDTDGIVNFGPGSGGRQQNTFSGGVTLNKGTITLGGGNSGGGGGMGGLGTGILTINSGTISGAGNIAGHALTMSGQVWNGDWTFGSNKTVDMGTGLISLGTAAGTTRTVNVNVSNGSTLTIGGAITNGTTANSFTKSGTATLFLTGTSTYSGTTTVTAGTLIVNGALNGGGPVQVNAGATLGGSGYIAGNTTIAGIHSPGNSPGVQTFGADLTYNSGASYTFQLAANSSTQGSPTAIFDQTIVGGNLDFTGPTAFNMAFNTGGTVDWTDSFWTSDQTWLVYNVTGSTTNFGNLSLTLSNWADDQGNLFDTTLVGASFSLSQTGNDVYLNYAVPEPSTWALLGVGLTAALALRRRRVSRHQTPRI